MFIAIPSTGRPTAVDQVTLRNLYKYARNQNVFVVVRDQDQRAYQNNLGSMAEVVVAPVEGIAKTREWILTELPKKIGERHVLMLDDDMDFCYRPNALDPKLETITSQEHMAAMLDQLEGWLHDGFVHVGLSARQGNNRPFYLDGVKSTHPYRDGTRMMNAYGYDTMRLEQIGVEFARVPVMEDFDLTLQLLRKGFENRVSFEYCWNQRGSGRKGGCSTYRTPEMQEMAAKRLQELHPDFVRVTVKRSKETSTSWKDMKERYDVNIAWRKAFEASGRTLA